MDYDLDSKGNLTPQGLARFLDFDNWSEEEFFTSVDYIICPHCKHRYGPRRVSSETGTLTLECGECGRQLQIGIMKTPLGKAWTTHKPKGKTS